MSCPQIVAMSETHSQAEETSRHHCKTLDCRPHSWYNLRCRQDLSSRPFEYMNKYCLDCHHIALNLN
jgi:hypothetical protein